MPIIKVKKKNNPYVILDKTFLNDRRLSLKSKGLLAYLLGLPPNWEIRVKELIQHFSDGKHAIYSTLKELRQFGYVQHIRVRNASGNFVCAEYHVFEIPEEPLSKDQDAGSGPDPDFQDLDNQDLEKEVLENRTLINNKNNKYKPNKIITAAIEEAQKSNINGNVAVSEKIIAPTDGLIGETLCAFQQTYVNQVAAGLVEFDPGKTQDEWVSLLSQALLDPEAYTKAGQDFFKKLNTIQKHIRTGQWAPPSQWVQEKIHEDLMALQSLIQARKELIDDQRHLAWLIEQMEQRGQSDGISDFYSQIRSHQTKIEAIDKKIQALKKGEEDDSAS